MTLHLVGGFLGSGKTTAIVNASKILMQRGERVGVVTNDQGRYLVDTAFVRAENIPAVEVGGGCFCCNYRSFASMLSELEESSTTVFAEAVGSCSDLVATVVRPSESMDGRPVASFSVFSDIRLLRLWLDGNTLPFSDDVVYLFSKQLEESELLVINKCDLLPRHEAEVVLASAMKRFPEKRVRLQSSLSDEGVEGWLQAIGRPRATDTHSLDIDYPRYADAEGALGWFDAVAAIDGGGEGAGFLREVLGEIVSRCEAQTIAVGHIKLLARQGERSAKLSATSAGVESEGDSLGKGAMEVTINARAEAAPGALRELVLGALSKLCSLYDRRFEIADEDSFRPAPPKPEWRLT